MTNQINLTKSFNKAGILRNDTVMIHGDAGIAAQFSSINKNEQVKYLIEKLLAYFDKDGTVLVPTFSYSFTKNEDFDIKNTPSDTGQFSEEFRLAPNIIRSDHPLFSFALKGKHTKQFLNTRIDDCFGKNTAFDLFNKLNGKIILLGSNFNTATFVHYVEQKYGVSYRYMKTFSGSILSDGKNKNINTTYYVRDININIKTKSSLELLKKDALNLGVIYVGEIGRFPLLVINSKDFLKIGIKLLKLNEYSLIEEGKI